MIFCWSECILLAEVSYWYKIVVLFLMYFSWYNMNAFEYKLKNKSFKKGHIDRLHLYIMFTQANSIMRPTSTTRWLLRAQTKHWQSALVNFLKHSFNFKIRRGLRRKSNRYGIKTLFLWAPFQKSSIAAHCLPTMHNASFDFKWLWVIRWTWQMAWTETGSQKHIMGGYGGTEEWTEVPLTVDPDSTG